jgi:hypothetical protein
MTGPANPAAATKLYAAKQAEVAALRTAWQTQNVADPRNACQTDNILFHRYMTAQFALKELKEPCPPKH